MSNSVCPRDPTPALHLTLINIKHFLKNKKKNNNTKNWASQKESSINMSMALRVRYGLYCTISRSVPDKWHVMFLINLPKHSFIHLHFLNYSHTSHMHILFLNLIIY